MKRKVILGLCIILSMSTFTACSSKKFLKDNKVTNQEQKEDNEESKDTEEDKDKEENKYKEEDEVKEEGSKDGVFNFQEFDVIEDCKKAFNDNKDSDSIVARAAEFNERVILTEKYYDGEYEHFDPLQELESTSDGKQKSVSFTVSKKKLPEELTNNERSLSNVKSQLIFDEGKAWKEIFSMEFRFKKDGEFVLTDEDLSIIKTIIPKEDIKKIEKSLRDAGKDKTIGTDSKINELVDDIGHHMTVSNYLDDINNIIVINLDYSKDGTI